jgi:hypothetical protein
MIIISQKAINFFELILGKGISALAFYPFIFIAPDTEITEELINHEQIHLRQQIELLIIPFYIWYLIELYTKGYMNISFEKEAYANEDNLKYLKTRKLFAFFKYFKK